jgi:uncharacterized protein (UPF0332 family)
MSDLKDIVEYRIGQSTASFKIALLVCEKDDWNHVCNRLYYSAFYVVSAYLASINDNAKTHNGVKNKFHNEFIKTGLLNTEYGKLYDVLFSNRQDADYADFVMFSQEEVYPLIGETKKFIEEIKSFIKI